MYLQLIDNQVTAEAREQLASRANYDQGHDMTAPYNHIPKEQQQSRMMMSHNNEPPISLRSVSDTSPSVKSLRINC